MDTITATGPVLSSRAVVRCTNCKTAHRVDYTIDVEMFAFNGRPASRTYVVTSDGRRVEVRGHNGVERLLASRFTCTACSHRGCTVKPVQGRFSESKPCNSRCTNAIGPSCDCQCGGENHASGLAHA